jgi:hypothetical protein
MKKRRPAMRSATAAEPMAMPAIAPPGRPELEAAAVDDGDAVTVAGDDEVDEVEELEADDDG